LSHYSLLKTKLSRESCIVKALEQMGFKKHMIENFGNKQENLRMWNGTNGKEKANIRIKGNGWGGTNYVGGLRNDIGFEKVADGSYDFHCDMSGEYNQAWVDKFTRIYSKEVVKEICQEQNFFISEETEDGEELVMKLQSPF
jgi:hypothetical protein